MERLRLVVDNVTMQPRFSIVILTHNRPDELRGLMAALQILSAQIPLEVIVVDNASTTDLRREMTEAGAIRYIRLDCNIGAAARNVGIRTAAAPIVICLDDDISGLSCEQLEHVEDLFAGNPGLGAVSFRVIEEQTARLSNWCHHLDEAQWAHRRFETYEISEGAVAFRSSAFHATRGYGDCYFISHEGPDLAIQLMNTGYTLLYDPAITVKHSYAQAGRAPWRRYYFDTRNTFILAMRALPPVYAFRFVVLNIAAMLVYSIRDGYLRHWFLGVASGLKALPGARRERFGMTSATRERYHRLRTREPGMLAKARRRLGQRSVGRYV